MPTSDDEWNLRKQWDAPSFQQSITVALGKGDSIVQPFLLDETTSAVPKPHLGYTPFKKQNKGNI